MIYYTSAIMVCTTFIHKFTQPCFLDLIELMILPYLKNWTTVNIFQTTILTLRKELHRHKIGNLIPIRFLFPTESKDIYLILWEKEKNLASQTENNFLISTVM